MNSTESVSKGCFIFKPKKVIDPFDEIQSETWNEAFTSVWLNIENKLKSLNDSISGKMLTDLSNYIKTSQSTFNKIPTAILLTGVNLPDHASLFHQLVTKLKEDVTPNIAVLDPPNCSTLKNIMEQMTGQLMNSTALSEEEVSSDLDCDEEEERMNIKRSTCNMPSLIKWFNNVRPNQSPIKKRKYANSKLVVVLPDFEGFSPKVLHDFILILSGSITKLPLVLVLGVATTVSAISDSLDHSVTSRLSLELFQSERSVYYLNNVLDKIFLTENCPFQLGPSIFKFLTNLFLFYDFSVCSFILGLKYCLMDHFFKQPYKILCTRRKKLSKTVGKLTKKDLQNIKELDSFKKYFSSLEKEEQESLNSDRDSFKDVVFKLLEECHQKLNEFHLSLRLLQILVADLPQAPLGKQIREFYSVAMCGNISKSLAYKECSKLLCFQAKNELMEKVRKMLLYLEENETKSKLIKGLVVKLEEFKTRLESPDVDKVTSSPVKSPRKLDPSTKRRSDFMKKLASLGNITKHGFEKVRESLVDYLFLEVLPKGLTPVTALPLHELLVCDSKTGLKRRVVGCPRADIHLALTDPHHYLQCDCCVLDDISQISSTLPDICILYKLHLESGKLINMYDWLQSFATILNPDIADDDQIDVDPQIQARFTQAVAELEFLGFIKSSKRKTDHVSRLTWGGSS